MVFRMHLNLGCCRPFLSFLRWPDPSPGLCKDGLGNKARLTYFDLVTDWFQLNCNLYCLAASFDPDPWPVYSSQKEDCGLVWILDLSDMEHVLEKNIPSQLRTCCFCVKTCGWSRVKYPRVLEKLFFVRSRWNQSWLWLVPQRRLREFWQNATVSPVRMTCASVVFVVLSIVKLKELQLASRIIVVSALLTCETFAKPVATTKSKMMTRMTAQARRIQLPSRIGCQAFRERIWKNTGKSLGVSKNKRLESPDGAKRRLTFQVAAFFSSKSLMNTGNAQSRARSSNPWQCLGTASTSLVRTTKCPTWSLNAARNSYE